MKTVSANATANGQMKGIPSGWSGYCKTTRTNHVYTGSKQQFRVRWTESMRWNVMMFQQWIEVNRLG